MGTREYPPERAGRSSRASKLAEVRLADLQRFVDELVAEGLSPPTIGGTILPLRAIYKRAVRLEQIAVNPTKGLELPAVTGGRDRIADPAEAAALIAAVPEADRALLATAFYGGLRASELKALRWSDVDLAAGLIRVERGWDRVEGEQTTKTGRGRRVPIAAVLRDHLIEHRLLTGRTEGFVFGDAPDKPVRERSLSKRADRLWRAAGLQRITLHECRHTFASLMIAAGVNAKALSQFMGHSSIAVTYDRYGHLMPGSEGEAADLLDAYLAVQSEQAEGKARAAGAEVLA